VACIQLIIAVTVSIGPKRRQAGALVRLKAQVVGEVKVLFRQTLSGL